VATTSPPTWDDGVTDFDQPETFWDVTRLVTVPLPVNPATTSLPTWDDGVTDFDQPETFWDVTRLVTVPLPVNPATTYIPFLPASNANFQFQVTLDGANYSVIVNWNLFGQRYYLNIYTLTGARVLTVPLIGSPNFFNISMTAGYFTTMLIYRPGSGNFEIL
jgi:hypothetical protein